MEHEESRRAQAAAARSAPTVNSANRACFWAGLNRYLETEARRTRWTPRGATGTPRRGAADDGQ